MLSEDNRRKRLQYSKEMKDFSWDQVLFSDEKTFQVGAGPSRQWQYPQHRVKRQVMRHPRKLHVWAAAGYYMKCKLFFFTDNLNSGLYEKIIKKNLSEKGVNFAPGTPPRLKKKWFFLQDNSPIHKSGAVMELLEKMLPNRIIEHPPSRLILIEKSNKQISRTLNGSNPSYRKNGDLFRGTSYVLQLRACPPGCGK